MSTSLRLRPEEYDAMIAHGAFDGLQRRIELIRGELREMNPAGPVHEDYIDYLTRWSTSSTHASDCVVRVQSSIDLDDSRPEPDIAWLKPGRYARHRPTAAEVMLIIEVADSSLADDLEEKASLYAQFKIAEYWVVDVLSRCIHVHRRSVGTRFMDIVQVSPGESIFPLCKPTAKLSLSELFVE